MKSRSIDQEWEDFKVKVIPAGVSKVQMREMRRAFYAGAVSAFDVITSIDTDQLTEEQCVTQLSKIDVELKTFFSKVGTEY